MPWNNQGGGGGWKSGGSGGGNGNGPWGQGGGNQPPDLEDILKRGQDRMKQVMDNGGLPGPLLLLAAAFGCAIIAWHAFFFRVNADQIGVVLRFGEFQRQEKSGLHFRLPPPIDEVQIFQVTNQRILDIGARTGGASNMRGPDSSMMLTGDENIVDLRFSVYWRIKLDQVQQWLFNIANQEATVKEVAESVMREVVGQTPLQALLTEARTDVQRQVQKRMQDILDGYGAGIKIDQVQLKEVDPPIEVIDAFREVQAATQDRETKIKEAQKYADQVVPVAKGEADRIKAAAQGYRDQSIAEATGQAARFLKILEEYKKAPEVTRQRLYMETMERVLGGSDKIVIDSKGGQGVVPYLPLNELTRKKSEGSN